MSREIKFRAWDYKHYQMHIDPYGDEYLCEGTPINDIFTSATQNLMGYHLMQYTGLKANGIEIYEGDILSAGADVRFEVCWDAGLGGYFMPNDYDRENIYPLGAALEELQVIGNVYESPELLEASR